ncbi:MAG: hypothetical protein ACK58T_35025, partial [Phycisphaerae bacterium]
SGLAGRHHHQAQLSVREWKRQFLIFPDVLHLFFTFSSSLHIFISSSLLFMELLPLSLLSI